MTKDKKAPNMTDSSKYHKVSSLYPYSNYPRKAIKKQGRTSLKEHKVKNDWEGATCSVCLEYPHNAVLLLCSSYNKGCRPYMCATGRCFSNCLQQYKKAYTKATALGDSNLSSKVPELLCPLCRGQVKGWTVVEAARKYLNRKKRACMLDSCSFFGSYRQLKKHTKANHPLGCCPRDVDPVLKEKWKALERERERSDVISTILSSTPGAMVLGDYVIEPPGRHHGGGIYDSDDYESDESLDEDDDDELFPLGNRGVMHYDEEYDLDYGSFDEDDRHGVFHRVGSAGAGGSRAVPAGSSFHRWLFGRAALRPRSGYRRGNGRR